MAEDRVVDLSDAPALAAPIDGPARLNPALHAAAVVAAVGAVGVADYLTGAELAFSFFYLLPIYLSTIWFGRWGGLSTSIASALVWAAADVLTRAESYSSAFVPYWNTLVRGGVFLTVTYLLVESRAALTHANELARVDHLTGIPNARHFYEAAEQEIRRARRGGRPLTAVYIDIDGFKSVNDLLGHSVGDRLLRLVGRTLEGRCRATDVVARLGGDEFALLLPETGVDGATQLLAGLRETLLTEARDERLPVTFSIGSVTFNEPPRSVDELVARADAVMYKVKQAGKDDVRSEVRGGAAAVS